MHRPGLVASDVDGTLLGGYEQVSGRTARAVAKVTASGTPFILVSGRPPRWIPKVAETVGLTGYAVCANGALLYDIGGDRIVKAHGLDPVQLHDVAHALEQAMPGIHLATERPVLDQPAFRTEPGYTNPWGNAENNTAPRAEVLGELAVKLLIRHQHMTSQEMALAANTVLDDSVTVTFSTNGGLLEISAGGVTKATGLSDAAELHDVASADVIAFGDMPNDIEMLKWAGCGVAMANAHPDVLAIADEITAANVDDGVAQVLERWF